MTFCQHRKKPLNILRSKKAYRLEIWQSIIYLKEHYYLFFLPCKILYKQKEKQISELAKTLCFFLKEHFREILFIQC